MGDYRLPCSRGWCAADNGAAVLSVSDRGEGIHESDLPHIFERFRRGQNVEGRIPGTGIGLAGVQRIVEQHQGTIAVDTKVGVGTTFTIRLPLRQPAADGRQLLAADTDRAADAAELSAAGRRR